MYNIKNHLFLCGQVYFVYKYSSAVIYFPTKRCLTYFSFLLRLPLCLLKARERENTITTALRFILILLKQYSCCFDVLIGLDICCNLKPKYKNTGHLSKYANSVQSRIPSLFCSHNAIFGGDLDADCPRKSRSDCSLWGF